MGKTAGGRVTDVKSLLPHCARDDVGYIVLVAMAPGLLDVSQHGTHKSDATCGIFSSERAQTRLSQRTQELEEEMSRRAQEWEKERTESTDARARERLEWAKERDWERHEWQQIQRRELSSQKQTEMQLERRVDELESALESSKAEMRNADGHAALQERLLSGMLEDARERLREQEIEVKDLEVQMEEMKCQLESASKDAQSMVVELTFEQDFEEIDGTERNFETEIVKDLQVAARDFYVLLIASVAE